MAKDQDGDGPKTKWRQLKIKLATAKDQEVTAKKQDGNSLTRPTW